MISSRTVVLSPSSRANAGSRNQRSRGRQPYKLADLLLITFCCFTSFQDCRCLGVAAPAPATSSLSEVDERRKVIRAEMPFKRKRKSTKSNKFHIMENISKDTEYIRSHTVQNGKKQRKKRVVRRRKMRVEQISSGRAAKYPGRDDENIPPSLLNNAQLNSFTGHTTSDTSMQTTALTTPVASISPKNTSAADKAPATITTPWIQTYASTHHTDALLMLPRDFIEDNFNLYNLALLVEDAIVSTGLVSNSYNNSSSPVYQIYRAALRMILDPSYAPTSTTNSGTVTGTNNTVLIEKAAEIIYLYAQARFITSQRGLDTVHKMLLSGKSWLLESLACWAFARYDVTLCSLPLCSA